MFQETVLGAQPNKQIFKNDADQEAHVLKMFNNMSACNRKNSCESCQRGERKHVWPEKKILKLSKIKPLAPTSRLIKISQNAHTTAKKEPRKSNPSKPDSGSMSTRNYTQISTQMSTAEMDERFVVKTHKLRIPRRGT